MKTSRILLSACLAVLLSLVFLAGCASDGPKTEAGPQAASSLGRYYEFDDVQIPNALELDQNNSFVFQVGTHRAGVLVFKGRVDVESLANFFVGSMAKDNWKLVSTYKYPAVFLFFSKAGKTCIIRINDGMWTTETQVWVAPGQ